MSLSLRKYYNIKIDLFLTEVVKTMVLNPFSQLQIIYSINKKKLLKNAFLGVMVSSVATNIFYHIRT